MKHQERVSQFVSTIWEWFSHHKRELPWRDLTVKDDTERAYRVLVSEVMLQQTQVPRVIGAYKRFLETFPKLSDLANAGNKDVIVAWRGMGYNNRALRLRDAAKLIGDGGLGMGGRKFPVEMKDLMSLPGVGHYTAAAVLNFAFGLPTPCLDTNIARILHRVFVGPEYKDGTWKKDEKYLLGLAEEVLEVALEKSEARNPKSETVAGPFSNFEFRYSNFRTADWHAALMDYGSLVQTKTSPKWEQCWLTEKGVMKTTPQKFASRISNLGKKKKKEPGREVAGKYIPNRIFRGKIIEELRDANTGLLPEDIGKNICIDWDKTQHLAWLTELIEKLKKDHLIRMERGKVMLQE